MTRDEAKKLLPIITAFAEGRKIEFQKTREHYVPVGDTILIEYLDSYRIAPEPKMIWVNEYDICIGSYKSKEDAERRASNGVLRIAVPYREVIEDE